MDAPRSRAPVEDDSRVSMVEIALAIAEMIDAVEVGDVNFDDPQRGTGRQRVDGLLARFRELVERLEQR